MITFDYGRGEGGQKCQNIDYVICERPLIALQGISKNYPIAEKFLDYDFTFGPGGKSFNQQGNESS